jgi:hypothetical protein
MKGADSDLVYNMTKAMIELYDEYKAGAPGNNGWHISRQVFDWVIPYHDGAIKYFKEKGLWKAEHDAHNAALIKRQDVLAAAWESYKKSAPDDEKAFAKGWMKARGEALTKAGLDVVQAEW